MTIWNLGSINQDIVYSVPHIPAPGETLASTKRDVFMGGKGANMSVAAARAGAQVKHIGAVGVDGRWAVDRLTEYGVDTRFIAQVDTHTAQAIIAVDPQGENAIILDPGANDAIPINLMRSAIGSAERGDWLICQNETCLQVETAKLAHELGLKVAYAAAPFDADQVRAVLPYLDFLIMNAVEMEQLFQSTGLNVADLGVETVIVTTGGDGGFVFLQQNDWDAQEYQAIPVDAVDTTGAGDTFTGYVLAGLDRGLPLWDAVDLATRAGALMVMRHGTADVIPDLKEVRAFKP
ncbi:ribokinase [Aestuariibius sp. HNIBRBA575]|uniref:ribokinase n=1 Tax=Aestuariibius sp. HNIBRBA575 TaxID=3233343 RepID=UPI0034A2FF8C